MLSPDKFTIVVPTHGRYGRLSALLDSIDRYSPENLSEVIVVDDSPVKQDIGPRLSSSPVRHLKLDRRVYISRAKNLGWRMASTEFIYFIDDDNIVGRETFDPLTRNMILHPGAAAIMPAVLYKGDPSLVWVYAAPFSKGLWSHELVGRNKKRQPSLEGKLLQTDALPNASLVRHSALLEAGGFDEALSINSSAYLCASFRRSGWDVLADTGSFIYHDVPLPGGKAFWASHGMQDPFRVKREIGDWYLLMRRLHPGARFFRPEAFLRSMKFVLPNSAAYLANGGERRGSLMLNMIAGTLYGLKRTGRPVPGPQGGKGDGGT